jgi:signal transduction histidine kinase/CHASE2 domain-containing sensor protein
MRQIFRIKARFVLLTLAGLAAIFFLEYLGFLSILDNQVYDLSFRIRGSREPGSHIVIVAVDEKTLARLGKWPLRRTHYADLLGRLKGASAVGFDIILAEPSPDDRVLADSIKKQGRVVLPVYVDSQLRRIDPLPGFSPAGVGHIHVEQGVDGLIRTIFHTLIHEGRQVRSLSSVVHELSSGEVIAGGMAGHTGATEGSQKELSQRDLMLINYYGPPGTFQRVSFSDVVEGRVEPAFFNGKIVIVGLTAVGIESELLTPFSDKRNRMAGAEVHASALNNLLDGRPLRKVDPAMRWAGAFLLAILYFLLFLGLSEKTAAAKWVLSFTFVTGAVVLLFWCYNLWLPPALFYLTITFVFGMTYIIRLDQAVDNLDREYGVVLSHLRWRKDERELPVSDKGLLGLFSTGGINARIKTLDKITGQLLIEKTLTDVTLLSDVYGIIVFGHNGSALLANDRARGLFAAIPLRELTMENLLEGLVPFVLEEFSPAKYLGDIRNSRSATPLTVSVAQPTRTFLKMDVAPVCVDEEDYFLFVFTDVTQIKEAEIRKGEMVSVVSHELKQPLSAILGFSELIMYMPGGKEKEYAGIINQEGERMSRFINTFLDISRLESGRQAPVITSVDLPELINDAVGAMTPRAKENEMVISMEIPKAMKHFMVDRDLLKQCIMNLIENAIKYSPPAKGIVVRVLDGEDQVAVEVRDNGYGIRKEDQPSIFEKFFRGSTATARGLQGSGLGLSFVKEAVETLGGSVHFESDEGTGTTFTITLPRSKKE